MAAYQSHSARSVPGASANQKQSTSVGASRIYSHSDDEPGLPQSSFSENNSSGRSNDPNAQNGSAASPFAFIDSLFGGKKPDTERLILVVLMIILARDGADLNLLIALGYLLI